MTVILDKYVEIKGLSDSKRTFERLDNEFIDIMYPDHFSDRSVIMLLDVNIDPYKEEDMIWLKSLLEDVLFEIGETKYFLTPYQ